MEIVLAELEHLEAVAKLFDQYRVFYQQSSDLEAARQFLQHRLQKQDSTILLARNDRNMVGFAQLYPSFSSVFMQPVWILNDLFVEAANRRQGVAKLLIQAAEQQARVAGAIRITLATQRTNGAAQALYESLGYSKDEVFDHYLLRL